MKISILEEPKRDFERVKENPCSEKVKLERLNEIVEGGLKIEEGVPFLYKGSRFVYVDEKIYGVSGSTSEKRIIEEDLAEELKLGSNSSNITSCTWKSITSTKKKDEGTFDEGVEIIIPWNQTVILKDCFDVAYNKKINVEGKIEEASFLMAPVNFKIYGQRLGLKEEYLSLEDANYILEELLIFLYKERINKDKLLNAPANESESKEE